MNRRSDISQYPEKIRERYENYLKTSFFFKDPNLRSSFQAALREGGSLLQEPYPEPTRVFKTGMNARDLVKDCFHAQGTDLFPALIDSPLYVHQEMAIRYSHLTQRNVVVATGTASGKTESFLYPILFELYRQHLAGELNEPGVRALILYPMNALANDQRERLGNICKALRDSASSFEPGFGQYTGQTPENTKDSRRNAAVREEERLPGELIFRDEMRISPPHILLTNYSMLEYLLIRPDDSPLFDGDRGKHWQFIVLDEAHQYRGAKGMEMGMLVRRLKQRLRNGGRKDSFRCIATSATISSGKGEKDRKSVAGFAEELFGEPFHSSQVIFGDSVQTKDVEAPRRYHAFLRALEGAFLVHWEGMDKVVLNRKSESNVEKNAEPLEIALCRECGQHYYVGRDQGGRLREAIRDPSQANYGVEYYLPTEDGATHTLCRCCGELSTSGLACNCDAAILVKQCESHKDHPDQISQCESCGYQRGGIGDPVQEIVHGSDGPNAVIATALHELLPVDKRKVLTFADSRQEAAFFAWYVEDSYRKLRDRNLILRAMKAGRVDPEGLSVDDLSNRLLKHWETATLFKTTDTSESKHRQILSSIYGEALTDERRLSLEGVGLVRWFIAIPDDLAIPDLLRNPPWSLSNEEARLLIARLLNEFRVRNAISLPDGPGVPPWGDVSTWPQQAYSQDPRGSRRNVSQWGGAESAVVKHFLPGLIKDIGLSDEEKRSASKELMSRLWKALRERGRSRYEDEQVLIPGAKNGTFRLNSRWLRIALAKSDEIWECDTCASISTYNIRAVCPRNRCPGRLSPVNQAHLAKNHYRILYELADLPSVLRAEEHTAQIESDEARRRQERFKNGETHLLSSSTTFEVGVDLGNLDSVFLRNVPPEPFNYTQRVGRAGRRDTPGLALTYCRRNPHDLYHYENPVDRVIEGRVHPPRLTITNSKIIIRHMIASVLSAFFKEHKVRFKNVSEFIGDWSSPRAASDVRAFCDGSESLVSNLHNIVPEIMYQKAGLTDGVWIELIAGQQSRLAVVEEEVCADYHELEDAKNILIAEQPSKWTTKVEQIQRRIKTITEEPTLNLLSRKAVIPKYGFPVDVVELDTRSQLNNKTGVSLQRDLSQAIAEYAPGGKVVANKLEWESCGVKVVQGKAFPVRYYDYDDARSFRQWNEGDPCLPSGVPQYKYLIPEFGFVTPLYEKPKEPRGRTRRLYTTRPFFREFGQDSQPETKSILGVQMTRAVPGTLVILCEGRNRAGFYICRSCGAHMTGPKSEHKSPSGTSCRGTLERFSLGHELVTDVVRLQFPQLADVWEAYSLAYAVLLGTAETLDVPNSDMNVTITGGHTPGETAIVLYDNVPGGAGLVAQLEQDDVFREMLQNAWKRVRGKCGCDTSCYGCLRSYRNQFAHPYLDRTRALAFLEEHSG